MDSKPSARSPDLVVTSEPLVASKRSGDGSTPDPLITERVNFESSPIHGTGGFAREDIPPGTRIIEYTGEQITKKESLSRCEQNNEYIFALDDEYDLDGNVPSNPARFLNHSCEPNCEALLENGRIWIVSLRQIRAGEELTFNYGYDLEDYRQHPCCCGALGCIGYILAQEFFDYVRHHLRT